MNINRNSLVANSAISFMWISVDIFLKSHALQQIIFSQYNIRSTTCLIRAVVKDAYFGATTCPVTFIFVCHAQYINQTFRQSFQNILEWGQPWHMWLSTHQCTIYPKSIRT
jgi:hypothetical protein